MDLSQLERPFTLEEIKAMVFALGADKAPKLDSFTIHFFKKFRDTINLDLLQLCEDFYA